MDALIKKEPEMPNPSSFRPEDISRLKEESERLRSLPEHADKNRNDIIKESLQSAFPVNNSSVLVTQTGDTGSEDFNDDLPEYLSAADDNVKSKVENLIKLSKEKGIGKAVNAARRESPFLLDALHDSLSKALLKEESLK